MTHSPKSPEPDPISFVCVCASWTNSACKGFPFFKEHQGGRYCVLHYPGDDKSLDFREALRKKLSSQDFNFRGVWFPDFAYFGNITFNKSVDFTSATFSMEANFNNATFVEEAKFFDCTFGAKADFNNSTFNAKANFGNATFCATADFTFATFNAEASFISASFKDYTIFVETGQRQTFGEASSLHLQLAKVEKPDRLLFHSLTLRPSWFINVDARKFDLINVDWNWQGLNLKQEIERISKDISPPHRILAVALRNLAVNAEENHRYEEASRFRYIAMDARRLESWRGFAPWRLGWWYWLASGYGERVWRAFVVLIGVWLLAAALYTRVGFVRWEPRVASEREAAEARRDEVGAPLRWQRALTYSLGVMTLQKPEPRPATDAAQALVMLETILGPVQAALLALAIRRKFMR